MGHILHHQGLNLDAELLHAERGVATAERGQMSYAIAIGRFYEELAERLERGAREAFAQAGHADVEVFDVPGAFELPLAASYAARSGASPALPAWAR